MRLDELVRAAAARYGEREALRIGSRSIHYRELLATADAWAGPLSAVARHDRPHRIGLLTDRTVEGYVGILAALRAGATVVPMSPDWPAETILTVIDDCALSSIIVDAAGLRALATAAHAGPHLSIPPVLAPYAGHDPAGRGVRFIDGTSNPVSPGVVRQGEDVAYILFTSGSTGRPKGVPITHLNVDAFLRTVFERYDFDADDVFSQTFDLTFDLAFFDMFVTWGVGATLVHTPAGAFRRLPRFVNEHRLTVWFSVPSAIPFSQQAGTVPAAGMPSLRWSLFCGEPLLSTDAATWQAAAPMTAIENLYGPTELTIACSAHRWSAADDGRASHGMVPIGAMFPGLAHMLVDGQVRPIGSDETRGELCVTGDQMFGGYLRADDNEGRFVERAGRLWYRTGDLVRRHGEVLLFDGRVDQQVKVHGYRIELPEIEHRLRQLAGIDQAVVVAVGVGVDRRLVAFYTGTRQEPVDLARPLHETLPRYTVPKEYVWLAQLPVNARGKTDRRALTLRAAADTTTVDAAR